MLKEISLIFFIMVLAFTLVGQSIDGVSTKSGSADRVKPLRGQIDKKLQADLLKEMKRNPKWQTLINNKKLAVGLVDMRDEKKIKFANVNGNHMMYAASLPKIAILLAATDALEKKELAETEEVLQDMKIMISHSSNQAATRMINRLGYEKIESVLTDPQYRLYDRDFGGGLWVGKKYASKSARYPDPILGLSHAATANQVCRFYYLLEMGKLVSPQRSQQMLDIMKDPALHHKFVNTLDKVAPQADIYRKSGSWKTFHADSALVEGPDRHYILVALIDDPAGESICRELVKVVEKVMQARPNGGIGD